MNDKPILDRFDMFPHIEERMSMTAREWLMFHLAMHRRYTKYLGLQVLKTPFDWIVLGDIIQDTRPEVIIEIGCFEGGVALWMAHLLDAMKTDGKVVGIDVRPLATGVEHSRIEWIFGDCLAEDTLSRVETLARGKRCMVIEDSDHKYHVTRAILDRYHRFIGPGCYFIVEDTIVEYLQVPPFPGPLKAVQEFAAAHADEFVIDRSREKYIFTHNPMGYLLRRQEEPCTS